MKQLAVLTASARRARMSGIAELLPQGLGDSRFHFRLYTTDPRVERILSAFHDAGFSAWPGRGDVYYHREYTLLYIREYDASDWEAAEYLEPNTEAIDEIYHVGRDDEGRLIVGGKDLVMQQDFEITIFNEWVAPQRTRAVLDRARLEGLLFKPVVVDPKQGGHIGGKAFRHPAGDKPPSGGPWWEITSTIKLPPVSPTMTLTDKHGNPLPPGDESVIYTAREGSYNHAELHFRRSDMQRMQPFDIARTTERFHVNPRLIVSNRFYRACADNGLRMNWVPVHVDPE